MIDVEGFMNKCKHCEISFDDFNGSQKANHSRWCKLNPKRSEYGMKGDKNPRFNKPSWNNGLSKENDIRLKEHGDKLKEKYKNGELIQYNKGKKKTDEEKEVDRQSALKSKHRRICKSSHKFIDKHNREFTFDSSWEDALAIRLDELDIIWDRPEPIQYNSKDGRLRNYFADFYIPHLDVYLDPKNEWVQKQQKDKIEELHKIIKLVILGSLDECKNFNI